MSSIVVPRGPASSLRRDPAAPWRHLDVGLLGAVLAVACLGVLMVFSATRRSLEDAGGDPYQYLKRQLLFVTVGAVLLVLTTLVDYRNLRPTTPLGYGAVLVLLVLVLSPLGVEVNGAQAWFGIGAFQLQPAEFGKIALVLMLAAYLSAHYSEIDGARLLLALALTGVPVALILLQPDLGTALVYLAVAMAVLLVAGARPKHILAVTLFGILAIGAALQVGVIELQDYQRERFTAFLDQEGDVARSAYNLDQSKTAIGNGGFNGAGLFKGTQTNLSYVPEQQTDFIFTVVAEELGFLGAATLLLLFAMVVWRTWRAAQLAKDLYGTLICTGVLAMFLFQVFQNVGMTMGIMPITGIPLPFVSYGGSSALTMFVAIGLVLNVHMRRFS